MIVIRTAQTGEHAVVIRLLQAAGLPYEDIREASLDQFLVATDNGEILGCIGLKTCGSHGLLRSLVVVRNAQSQGIGTSLVQAIEQEGRRSRLSALFLLTMTAELFFIERGYQRTDRSLAPLQIQASSQFVGLCPSQASCLYKSL